MESLSSTFSKKTSYNVNGKSLYDDVFGGPSKFGVPTLAPRVEDYTEIFGGGFRSSRTSSIPTLQLPVFDDYDDDDVHSSRFNYSEIFGGFHDLDFAISYEDLVTHNRSGYEFPDQAWSPAQSETPSDESDPSACSERSQSSAHAVHDSSDGTKQFNISYHRASQRSNGVISDGMTSITHSHAIPGFTDMINGSQDSRSTEDEYAPIQATVDLNHSMDSSERVLEEKQFRRSRPHATKSNILIQESDTKLPEKSNESGCTPDMPFLTVLDINLRTKPSHLPPPLRPPPASASKKGDSSGTNASLRASKSYAFERIPGDSSQSYFDMEVYASSSAAASTASIKDAMEKAQAKLRSTKELKERKKQNVKDCATLHFDSGVLEEMPSKTLDRYVHCKKDIVGGTCTEEMEGVMRKNEVISGTIEGEKRIKFTGKCADSEQGKSYTSSEAYIAEGTVAWRKAMEFFEVVETFPSRGASKKVKNESLLNNMDLHGHKQFEAAIDALEHQETCKRFTTASKAPASKEESKEKLGKESYKCGNKDGRSNEADLCSQLELKKTVKAEQDSCDLRMSKRNVKVDQQQGTMAKPATNCHETVEYLRGGEQNMRKCKTAMKLSGDWERLDDENSKVACKQEKSDRDKIVSFKREQKDQDVIVTFEWEHSDDRFGSSLERKENEGVKNKTDERQESDRRRNDACRGEDMDMKMTEIWEQESKTTSPVASEVEFGNVLEEANEWEETELVIDNDGKWVELREQTKDNKPIKMVRSAPKQKTDVEFHFHMVDKDVTASVVACKPNDETLLVNQMSEKLAKDLRNLKATKSALSCEENEKLGFQVCERESEVGMTNLLAKNVLHSVSEKQYDLQLGKNHIRRADAIESTSLHGHLTNSSGAEEVEIPSSTDQRTTYRSTERKDTHLNEIITPEVQKMDERLKTDRQSESECLRMSEEEREREREREKDRMSLDREALERSFAEARERAERASMGRSTAEVRQRAMTEAQERLEKASAEAREKSSAVKASMDARLRSECVSVERAAAAARERAFGKAVAEKAIQEARERVERSSDKFFAFSRSTELRQSYLYELPVHQTAEASKLRYSYSSAHAGIEGESPQRCKARLERYQRTSERAAKALAEKNMRDLLFQREETERNRLAETLDAEIKRWSSGKGGNLRALLSTLQYILGPDSGWQPIPLTEVITSAAVKKAYRKATLCVHPDKLQQRGASIQQKYVCEKVFDLLKEAWSKFNSAER